MTSKKSILTNAKCNAINAYFSTNPDDAYAISFSEITATMKACPDITLEKQMITALYETRSYNISSKGNVILRRK